ncbi:MAG: DUF445 family protein [Turicibacter sp.]|nr:DUF445 family protein [Turicibacter sp.]
MNHLITVLILTIVGALIGWITNILAIKLLFRPLKPIKIPFTPFVILGLIPKRRSELAKVIGEVVAHELISVDEMLEETIKDEDLQHIKGYVKRKIKVVISEKISIIPFPFKSMIQAPINQMIEMEVDQGLDDIIINIKDIVQTRLNIETFVEKKINAFDLSKLEEIILKVAKKELRYIEIIGFCLGGVIGLIQGIILMYL